MSMTLTFLGAARTVTGSRYLLETPEAKVLVDGGMFQDRQYLGLNWENYGLVPRDIDAVVLTHGHLDHCGWLPRLVKDGFKGPIYCTPATADLVPIIVMDSARIQTEDARNKAKRHAKEKRKNVRPAVPLYDVDDAEKTINLIKQVSGLDRPVTVAPGVVATWGENGHILGATWVGIEAGGRRLVFSGDIGRWDRPILHDPAPPVAADYLVVESTYGDRSHIDSDTEAEMRAVLDDSAARGGNLLIPSFSVERAQELLYALSAIGEKGGLRHESVYLDSPMATKVTDLFRKHPEECDDEMLALIRAGKSPFEFAGLHYTAGADDSKRLNDVRKGAVIIAGNGMCTGGRIKHHLLHNLERPEATVLFVGYQAAGTLGRQLVDGAKEVRLFNRVMRVKAAIRQLNGLSGHADRNELLRWTGVLARPPRHCFVTHGEEESATAFAASLREKYGWETSVPAMRDKVVLE